MKTYMMEIEKGLVKEKYSRIVKTDPEVNKEKKVEPTDEEIKKLKDSE